jgi:hypothetical protein
VWDTALVFVEAWAVSVRNGEPERRSFDCASRACRYRLHSGSHFIGGTRSQGLKPIVDFAVFRHD